MSEVHIDPLPAWARKLACRPMPVPVFPDGDPTREEVELALALFAELDAESQAWYGGEAFVARLQKRLAGALRP